MQRHEKIENIAGRIMSFAGLRYYQHTTDPARTKFLSDMQEKITIYTTPLVFFSLELNRLEDDAYAALFAENDDLARYKPVFDRIRAMKPYQLSDELEKFLHDMGVVGDAWERLFDETIAGLEFDVDGEVLGIEATLNCLTEQDRDKREAAARELARSLATTSAPSRACTTRPPRKRKSWTAGAACRRRRPAGTCRTTSSPRWSRRCAMPSSPPIPSSRTAITSSSASGWASTGCRSGTATRRCRCVGPAIVGWDEARETVMNAYSEFDPAHGRDRAAVLRQGLDRRRASSRARRPAPSRTRR